MKKEKRHFFKKVPCPTAQKIIIVKKTWKDDICRF